MLCRNGLRRVDEDGGSEGRRFRRAFHEARWIACVCRLKNDTALIAAILGATAVNVFRRKQSDSGMAMFHVVPGEESAAIRTSLFDICKRSGKGGAVLERLVMRLDKRVVVGDVRS